VVTLLPYPESCGNDHEVVVRASLEIQATVEAETLKRWEPDRERQLVSVQTRRGAECALRACMGIDKSRALKTGLQGCTCLRADDWVTLPGIPDPVEMSIYREGVDAFNSGKYNMALKKVRIAMGEVFERIGHQPSNARQDSCPPQQCALLISRHCLPFCGLFAGRGLCPETPFSPLRALLHA